MKKWIALIVAIPVLLFIHYKIESSQAKFEAKSYVRYMVESRLIAGNAEAFPTERQKAARIKEIEKLIQKLQSTEKGRLPKLQEITIKIMRTHQFMIRTMRHGGGRHATQEEKEVATAEGLKVLAEFCSYLKQPEKLLSPFDPQSQGFQELCNPGQVFPYDDQ
jgi:hypothetical protein